MALLKAAHMHGSWDTRPNSAVVYHSTTEGNPDYVECALYMLNTDYALELASPLSEAWLHLDFRGVAGRATNGVNFGFFNDNTELFACYATAGFSFFGNPSGPADVAFRTAGGKLTGSDLAPGPTRTIDMHLKIVDGGVSTIDIYVNDTLLASYNEMFSFASPTFNRVRFQCAGTGCYISQVIVANESTVGWRAMTVTKDQIFNGGTDNDWVGDPSYGSGSFANNLCSKSSYNENNKMITGNISARTNTRQNYQFPTTGPTTIAGVVVAATGKNTPGSAINDIAWYHTNDGVFTFFPPFGITKDGNVHHGSVVALRNPQTNNPWTGEEIDNAYIGVVAV